MQTKNETGKKVSLTICEDAIKESKFVANKILEVKNNSPLTVKWSDFAVLYRSNVNHSTTDYFQKSFSFYKIPFTFSNGKDFYSKKPVRDILSFFRFFNFILF